MAKPKDGERGRDSDSAIAQQLEAIRNELRDIRQGKHQESASFGEIWAWFKPRYLPKKSAADFARRVEKHLLPAIKHMTSATLTASVLDEVFKSLESVQGPQSLNHIKNHGSKIIRLAAAKSKLWPADVANPFREIATRDVPKKKRLIPTPEECGRILGVTLSAEKACMFALGFYYGLRKSEVLAFRREYINIEKDTLRLVSTKNSLEREIPILEEFRPYLAAQLATAQGELLFMKSDGTPYRFDTKLKHRLATSLKAARMVSGFRHQCRRCYEKEILSTPDATFCRNDGHKRVAEPIPLSMDFHNLRHVCATLHKKAGCDPLIIQLLLGHKRRGQSITEAVYTHFTDDEIREHLNRMTLRSNSKAGGGTAQSGGNSSGHRPSKPVAVGSSPAWLASNLPTKPFHSVREVASFLCVSRATVQLLIGAGKLQAFRVGGQFRITPEALSAYLDSCLVEGGQ